MVLLGNLLLHSYIVSNVLHFNVIPRSTPHSRSDFSMRYIGGESNAYKVAEWGNRQT